VHSRELIFFRTVVEEIMPKSALVLKIIAWWLIIVNLALFVPPLILRVDSMKWMESLYYAISMFNPVLLLFFLVPRGNFHGVEFARIVLLFYFATMVGMGIGLLKRKEWSRKIILFLQLLQMLIIGCFGFFYILTAFSTHFHPKSLIVVYLAEGLACLVAFFLPALFIFIALRRKEIKNYF